MNQNNQPFDPFAEESTITPPISEGYTPFDPLSEQPRTGPKQPSMSPESQVARMGGLVVNPVVSTLHSVIRPEHSTIEAGYGFRRAAEGVKQLTYRVGEYLNLVPPGTTQMLRDKFQEEAAFYESTPYGSDPKLSRYVAEAAPGFLIPGSKEKILAGGASALYKGIMARTGAASLSGAISGATIPAKDDEEMASNALFGATVGLLAKGLEEGLRFRELNALDLMREAYPKGTLSGLEDYLTKKTGVSLTPFEGATVSTGPRPNMGTYEVWLRGKEDFSRIFTEFDNKRLTRAVTNIDDAITDFGGRSDAAGAGARIKAAYDNTVKTLDSKRKEDFVRILSPYTNTVGSREVFPVNNLRTELTKFLDEYSDPALGPQAKAVTNQIKSILDDIEPGQKVSVDKMLKRLSHYSEASSGSSKIFFDLSDNSIDKKFGVRVFKALLADLDDVANNPGTNRELALAVKEARKQYADISNLINDISNTTLGSMLNLEKATPEDFYKKFIKLPSTAKNTAISLLDKSDPMAMNTIRATRLTEALRAGTKGPTNIPGSVGFDVDAFLKAIPEDDWKYIYKGVTTKDNLRSTIEAVNKISSGVKQPKFTDIIRAEESIKGSLVGTATGNKESLIFMAKAWVRFGGGEGIAKMMLEPHTRQALLTLANTSNVDRAANAASIIMASNPDSIQEWISNQIYGE